MGIAFDDAAATALTGVLRVASDELRTQGVLRRGAVEHAVDGFAGGYADLFTVAASIESEDRGRLSGILHDLADTVWTAQRKAEEERDRQAALAAWRLREKERERRRATDDFFGGVGANMDAVFDPQPSDTPVLPPTVSAAFAAHDRHRASGGGLAGTSSADPDRLRVFVSQAGASNIRMGDELQRVQNAWTRFTSACSWVPVGSTSFLGGSQRLLEENREDVTWIDRVATAFDAAGGARLSNTALDLAVAATDATVSDRRLLAALGTLSGDDLAALLTASPGLRKQLERMDPAVVHAWWQTMNPDAGDRYSAQQELLLTTLPVVFGNLEGIPNGARDHANQIALTAAISDIDARIEALRRQVDGASPTLRMDLAKMAQLEQSLTEMESQRNALRNIRDALTRSPKGATRFLISLTEDQPPLAAISIGDLDTATSVTYAIPGMGTTTNDMTGWTQAAQNLHDLLPEGSAVVSWIGYQPPPVPSVVNLDFGVLDVNHAVAGGHRLATALTGLAAVRGDTMPPLHVVAHSYGTTTAAVALTQPGIHVNTFITLGSAGLPDNIHTTTDLNADTVYAGQARNVFPWEPEPGDQWAWTGRTGSRDHHLNPVTPDFGAHPFGVDTGSPAGRPVTDHSPLKGKGDDAGYLDEGTESIDNVALAIKGETTNITPYKPLGPTDYQRSLIDGSTIAH
ncbi:alpha/beta hydrolase [Leifsonia sp. Le1]|uniref:alpha/beta hydrolase n=1 Tax=Leifsonia sp. Le1 TaxID=3404918 RepID=UPI003EBD8B62